MRDQTKGSCNFDLKKMNRHLQILFFFLITSPIVAQDCYDNYNYYQSVILTPPTPLDNIEASTVALPFNTKSLVDEGKLNPDGSDLRITDNNCTELPFFVQGVSDRSMNAIYIKVPNIASAGLELQIYYGGPENAETQINGTATFDFFDDFEDDILDMDKWEAIGEFDLWEESNGQMRFTGSYGNGGIFKYVTPKWQTTEPVTVHFSSNASNSQVYGIADTSDLQRVGLRYDSGLVSYDTMDIIALMFDTLNGGTNPGIEYPFVQVTRNELNLISISAFLDENNKLNFTRFENFSSGGKNTDTLLVNQMDFDVLRPFFASFLSANIIEFVGISSSTAFPEISYGSEQMLITAWNDFVKDPIIDLFPNPATNYLFLKTGEMSPVSLVFFDLKGQKIREQLFQNKIDISFLHDGEYLLKIEYPEGRFLTKTFVKVKRD